MSKEKIKEEMKQLRFMILASNNIDEISENKEKLNRLRKELAIIKLKEKGIEKGKIK